MEISNQTIILSKHVDVETGNVRGLNARNAIILGPAVLAPSDGSTLDSCTWATSGGIESVIWEINPTVRPQLEGATWLFDCNWQDCTLVRMGIALAPEGLTNFLATATVLSR